MQKQDNFGSSFFIKKIDVFDIDFFPVGIFSSEIFPTYKDNLYVHQTYIL